MALGVWDFGFFGVALGGFDVVWGASRSLSGFAGFYGGGRRFSGVLLEPK